MEKETSSLEAKYSIIKENLREQVNIMVTDISALFPELEKSSMYWTISKLVKEGYLKRIRNGVYSLNEIKGKSAISFLKQLERLVKCWIQKDIIIIFRESMWF